MCLELNLKVQGVIQASIWAHTHTRSRTTQLGSHTGKNTPAYKAVYHFQRAVRASVRLHKRPPTTTTKPCGPECTHIYMTAQMNSNILQCERQLTSKFVLIMEIYDFVCIFTEIFQFIFKISYIVKVFYFICEFMKTLIMLRPIFKFITP